MNKNMSFICSIGLILTAAIWGFAFVVVKDSLDYIGPDWMVGIRFAIASIVLALIFFKRFKKLNRRILWHGVVLGIFMGLAYITQTIGCNYTTAGKNAFLTTIYVILVPVLGWPILRKRPTWYTLIAALLSLTGIGMLALNGENGAWYRMNVGDILTLVCGLFYALHMIFGAKYVAADDVILITVIQFAVASVLGFAAAFIMDEPLKLETLLRPNVVVSLLYLGLLSSMLCFLMQNIGFKYVQPALASLFLSLESVFGVVFSMLFLKERLTIVMALGCVLIFGAILISEVLPGIKTKADSRS